MSTTWDFPPETIWDFFILLIQARAGARVQSNASAAVGHEANYCHLWDPVHTSTSPAHPSSP